MKALKVFKLHGIEKTTMDEIAHESGFGKATLYYYYASKDEVFIDIMEKGWFFDSAHGSFIAGKYLFGNSNVVTNDELKLEIVQWDGNTETDIQVSTLEEVMEERVEMDTDTEQSQYVILEVIIIVAIAAAIYYMKGYKR